MEKGTEMNIWTGIASELSKNSLLELQSIIKKRLKEEDAGTATENYGVREHTDWRQQADILEQAMTEREINFEPIEW